MKIRYRRTRKGYTLTELMVVAAIIAVLSAVSVGVYSHYVERAEKAQMYKVAGQIITALSICESEYVPPEGADARLFWSDAFLKAPNHPKSILYPYVGETTKDCTGYFLLIGKEGSVGYHIIGFTYRTEKYEAQWKKESGITVKKR